MNKNKTISSTKKFDTLMLQVPKTKQMTQCNLNRKYERPNN